MTRALLLVVALALAASACEDVGDQNNDGRADTAEDYFVYCSTHPGDKRCVPSDDGKPQPCGTCNDNPNDPFPLP